MRKLTTAAATLAAFCIAGVATASAKSFTVTGDKGSRITAEEIARFDEPWAMTFLPDGAMLVTTKPGKMFRVTKSGEKTEVEGLWDVAYGGQGGLGDVVLHPDFSSNNLVYVSYAASDDGGATAGAEVVRARFDASGERPRLSDVERIWSQQPRVSGRGHYSHRIAFGPDGKLFISAGDRQKLTPAQDFDQALGKIIRLNDDGTVPADNPWQNRGELAKTFWSIGHRNPLGMAFDADGRLWAHEMGPRHGDELNLVRSGRNYGWPLVSYGNHYSGLPIPDHDTRPDFEGPKAWWVPAISPAGFIIYRGDLFSGWKGDGFIGGLSSRALIRVEFNGEKAREAERFSWRARIREVAEGPSGAIWVLEDRSNARLLKLTP